MTVLGWILICSVLFMYGVLTTIVIWNQIKRNSRLEEITNAAVANLEEVDRLIRDSEKLLNNPKLTEAFAHDDEVGGYFQNLKDMQKILNSYLGYEEDVS